MYEIETKVLLQTRENADKLLDLMGKMDTDFHLESTESQRNHYFSGWSLRALADVFIDRLRTDEYESLMQIAETARSESVRTRYTGDRAILVVKAAVDDTTSENGTIRREWEKIWTDTHETALDALVESAGYAVLSKWSRDRETYRFLDMTVCLDRNAGYGYLAEFERIVDSPSLGEHAKSEIRRTIESLGFSELPHDRMDRMFAYYNEHWRDYYGTDRVFTIE